MNMSLRFTLLVILSVTMLGMVVMAQSEDWFHRTGVCIRNCAQCKQLFEKYFSGEKCQSWCIEYEGKYKLDCFDPSSIEPFIIGKDNNVIDENRY